MIFISKFKRHRITFKGAKYVMIDNERTYVPGLQAAFSEGAFETQDEDIIERMLKHPMYGIEFYAEGVNIPSDEGLKIKQKEESTAEGLVTSCPTCSFKAATLAGLKAHMRAKHPDN